MTTVISPPPPQPEQLVPASQTSRVSPKTVDGAVNALLKWRTEKSKTEKPQLLEQDEFVYLVVTLKKIPQTSRTNAHRIRLPHPLINATEDSPEICLIIDDRAKSGLTKPDAMKKIKSENIPVTKILKLSKLKSDYRPFEAKRKLCDSYDMFFADRRVIPLLPRLIGKKFFTSKKIPVPLDLKHKNWKEQMEKACGSAMFFMRTGTCSVIKIGKLSMESNEIAENVMETLNGVVEILPSKWKYIRSLHLKLSESLALPIYQSVPDLKLKIDAFESEKSIVKEDIVSESSEKKVSGKGKKKKGRIHEVRYMDSNVSEVLDDDEIGDDGEIGDDDEEEVKNEIGDDDEEVKNEIVEKKKRKKEMIEVAENEKPMKKAMKPERKKEIMEVAESEKPMKKASKGKLKPERKKEIMEVAESEKPMKKASMGKMKPEKSKDGLRTKKTKIVRDVSGDGLKPMKKKSVVRN